MALEEALSHHTILYRHSLVGLPRTVSDLEENSESGQQGARCSLRVTEDWTEGSTDYMRQSFRGISTGLSWTLSLLWLLEGLEVHITTW